MIIPRRRVAAILQAFSAAFLFQISPVIERVFSFDDVPCAFDKVQKGHNRGKTVVDVAGASEHDATAAAGSESASHV